MAQLGQTFDHSQVEPGGFDELPTGEYVMQITESEVRPTNSGDGNGLNLKWVVTEGECENRVMFQWLNIEHANAQAQTIAQQELKQICEAMGLGPINDSDELHYIPVRVKIGPSKNKKSGEMQQRIKKVSPLVAAAPAGKAAPTPAPAQQRPAQQQQKPATPPAGAPGARPWRAGAKPAV